MPRLSVCGRDIRRGQYPERPRRDVATNVPLEPPILINNSAGRDSTRDRSAADRPPPSPAIAQPLPAFGLVAGVAGVAGVVTAGVGVTGAAPTKHLKQSYSTDEGGVPFE